MSTDIKQQPISLAILRARRDEIIALAEKHGASHVRIFGSVARGEDRPNDLDILVKWNYDRVSAWGGVGLDLALEKLLGYRVDVVSEDGLSPLLKNRILDEAVLL